MSLDSIALMNLGESMSVVGQLIGIVVCKQHPKVILSGRHRSRKGAKAVSIEEFDVDERAKRLGISHQAMEILAISHFNVQRQVGREERRNEIAILSKHLQAQGIPKDQVATKVVELMKGVIGRAYVYELVGPEFKKPELAESIKKGLEKKQPYSKGLSEKASEHLQKTFTDAHMTLAAALQRRGVELKLEEPFRREGELTKDGKEKSYSADILLLKRLMILEVEGAGSASSENAERDAFFKAKHYTVIHLPNELVERFADTIAELVAVLLEDVHSVDSRS